MRPERGCRNFSSRSIALFAVITVVLGCLKIGYFVGFSDCLSPTEGVFPVTHAVHTLVQVYFLWGHAKDIIQSFKTLERFGVIHSVFTNLLLWANSVLNESKHQLNEHKERLITLGFGNITIELDDHNAAVQLLPAGSLCRHLPRHLLPLPFQHRVPDPGFHDALRAVEEHRAQRGQPSARKMQFRFQGVAVGSGLGLAVLAATIGVVAVYLIHIGRSKTKSEAALTLFYLYASALLTLMGAAGLAGLRLYRLHEQSLDESRNPARKLDADLLVGTASGSWLLSWGSILAILCAGARPAYTWYNLPYSVLVIAEKYIQNLFIIEAAHRAPGTPREDIGALRVAVVCNGRAAPLASSCLKSDAVARDLGSQMPPAANGSLCLREVGGPGEAEPTWAGAPGPACRPRLGQGRTQRSLLRNIAAFLFLCNISLWIPPAFGCRPEYDNGLEEIVFGFEPWIIVVNLAMPFSIFYRMHAAASLFEVYSVDAAMLVIAASVALARDDVTASILYAFPPPIRTNYHKLNLGSIRFSPLLLQPAHFKSPSSADGSLDVASLSKATTLIFQVLLIAVHFSRIQACEGIASWLCPRKIGPGWDQRVSDGTLQPADAPFISLQQPSHELHRAAMGGSQAELVLGRRAGRSRPRPLGGDSLRASPARNQTQLRAPGRCGLPGTAPRARLLPVRVPSAGSEGAHRGHPAGGARGEKSPRAPRGPSAAHGERPPGALGSLAAGSLALPPGARWGRPGGTGPTFGAHAARPCRRVRVRHAAAGAQWHGVPPRGSGGSSRFQGGALEGAEGAAPLGPAQVLTAGLLTLLIVWTLLGNALVCAAVVRSRHLRARMTHVFIVSLAVSDLLVALLVMPWKAVAEVAGHWPFGAFCDVWVAFDIMCSTASILNLCVISVDRYWAISSPFRYQRRMTRRVALGMVGLAWTLSILISFIPVQLHWHRDEAGSPGAGDPPPADLANGTSWGNAGDPEVREENCDSSLNRTYAIASSLISFYIPVAIMIVTYARIYRIAQAQIRRIACLERAGQRAQRGGSPVGGAPAPACGRPSRRRPSRRPEAPAPGFPCVSDTTFDVFVWFGWANSSLNPVIYAFNADFRKVFAQLLGHELISYDPDTVFSGETAATDSHVVPSEVTPRRRAGDQEEEAEGPWNHMGRISQASQRVTLPPESVWELDCEGETSLGKTTPFTQTEMSRQAAVIDVTPQETARAVAKLGYPGWSRRASWRRLVARDPDEAVGVGASLTPGGRVRQAEGLAPARAWERDGAGPREERKAAPVAEGLRSEL
ncbi:hypothetical protein QTO34_008528 [Cnephaeus nilssonii]|uniref:D(1B) dopamine receptor n=1 Tax=Cnephaeus nilssonii TaxID=3371016 RepID=A0AA40IAG2_CNENI|nr:hypothetical protein QTO34_008528 [Eptesicus nilssonii]